MQPFKHGHADNCELETMGARWSNYVYVSCKNNATCEGKLNFFDTIFEVKINQSDKHEEEEQQQPVIFRILCSVYFEYFWD